MRIRKIAVAATMAACALAAGTGARADTILDYTFTPGTTFTFYADNCYNVSGTFDYDATSELVTSADVTATEACELPIGPFVFTGASASPSLTIVTFIDDGFDDADQLTFLSSLALGGTDDLSGTFDYYFEDAFNGTFEDSGSATTSAIATPEPASLSLFGMGLIGFALRRRRRRHG